LLLGESSVISGKTKEPAQIELDIALSYRLKIEFVPQLFQKFPAKNHHTTMVSSAKVRFQHMFQN